LEPFSVMLSVVVTVKVAELIVDAISRSP